MQDFSLLAVSQHQQRWQQLDQPASQSGSISCHRPRTATSAGVAAATNRRITVVATANSKGLNCTAQEPNAASLETMQEESNRTMIPETVRICPQPQRNRQTKHSIQKKRERSKSNRETETKWNTIVQFERNPSTNRCRIHTTKTKQKYVVAFLSATGCPSRGRINWEAENVCKQSESTRFRTCDADPEDVAERWITGV